MNTHIYIAPVKQKSSEALADADVEWMCELRQSPLCPPQTYDLHSKDTIKFLVYYSTALRLPVLSNCALKSNYLLIMPELIKSILKYISSISRHNMIK